MFVLLSLQNTRQREDILRLILAGENVSCDFLSPLSSVDNTSRVSALLTRSVVTHQLLALYWQPSPPKNSDNKICIIVYHWCLHFLHSWVMLLTWRRLLREQKLTPAVTSESFAVTLPCTGSGTTSARSRWGRLCSSYRTARRRKGKTASNTRLLNFVIYLFHISFFSVFAQIFSLTQIKHDYSSNCVY